jgi:hypothetical protein
VECTLAWHDSMAGEQAVHGIWGFAKDFGLSGLKVGALHTRDPEVRTAARALASRRCRPTPRR